MADPFGGGFYSGYLNRQQANEQADLKSVQGMGALQAIQANMMKQQQAQQQLGMQNELRSKLAALTPEQRANPEVVKQLFMQYGETKDVLNLLAKPQPQGQSIGAGGLRLPDGTIVPPVQRPVQERPTSIGAGGLRLPDGTVVPPVERPQQPRQLLPNQKVRDRIVGDSLVQEELQPDGTYLEIGRGPRFAKQIQGTAGERDTPHAVVGVTPEGNQAIRWARPSEGNQQFDISPTSIVTTGQIRERQLAKALETKVKPHLDVLDDYQRFEEIRATGDNSQANMFLAQQLTQMSNNGQRALRKDELERILGSGDLGNDWVGRATNMISQMASGVRTPTIDKRLNDLADAMGKASAERIGQEIRNTIATTPSSVDPSTVVGNKPRIYGRFIITPSGKVHTFKNSTEARAKLNEASQRVGQ